MTSGTCSVLAVKQVSRARSVIADPMLEDSSPLPPTNGYIFNSVFCCSVTSVWDRITQVPGPCR